MGSSTRTFDQDWELFKTKASSYVPSTRASSRASLDKNDKSNAKIDTHLTPGLILTVFDLWLPVKQVHSCSGLVQIWIQQKSACRENFNSREKIRQMAESRTTLWNLTRKIAPEVDLQAGSGIFWFWNRMQNKSSVSECNWLVIVQKLCICLFVCLFVCFVYIFLHYLNLRCSAEI